MEIKTIVGKLLRKHEVDVSKDFYLKLTMPPYMDLVIQRNEDIVAVGHYIEHKGELIGDPVLVFSCVQNEWLPLGIEQFTGDTICAYFDNGKRVVYQDRIKEFNAFQKMFALNLKEQGWLKNGEKVQSGLVCGVMFIEKGSPNPMGDLSEYANPNENSDGVMVE